MRIYTPSIDLAFKEFDFPDGQPHIEILTPPPRGESVTVEMAIKSPRDLFLLGCLRNILFESERPAFLDIRYLLGARMDRAIGPLSPLTIDVVKQVIGIGWGGVRVLDAHNPVAVPWFENVLPTAALRSVLERHDYRPIVPDKGARGRVEAMIPPKTLVVPCEKTRDLATGRLSGFEIVSNHALVKNTWCLIIDDICDGGGTFSGLSKVLRAAGAVRVDLFVTHGIFSKGTKIEGIDQVYTTNSYFRTSQWDGWGNLPITIPISMRDLK